MSNRTYLRSVIYIYINLCSSTLKSYVGFTTNFHIRNNAHKNAASRGDINYFYNSVRKHGWQNFVYFILAETDDIEYARKVLEPYYIKLCKSLSTKNGYNLTLGGDGISGWHHSDETKLQMSKKHLGKIIQNLKKT